MSTQKRLLAASFVTGVPGIAVVMLFVLPMMLAGKPLQLPLWAVQVVSTLQSFVMLAVAVWAGTRLSARVGLRAPALSAWAAREPVVPALRRQLVPGLLGGLAGAAVIALTGFLAPPALQQLATTVSMPALARVLYGGVTEELLMRWGAMTFFAWLFGRVFQRGTAAAGAGVMVAAIAVAALGFGIGHLPAAATLLGQLTPGVMAYVVLGNAAFGFIAGALYWKVGLEAAIIAHMSAHTILLLCGF